MTKKLEKLANEIKNSPNIRELAMIIKAKMMPEQAQQQQQQGFITAAKSSSSTTNGYDG